MASREHQPTKLSAKWLAWERRALPHLTRPEKMTDRLQNREILFQLVAELSLGEGQCDTAISLPTLSNSYLVTNLGKIRQLS